MESSQLTIDGHEEPVIFRQQWLYLAANDTLVGKIGRTSAGRTGLVARLDQHAKTANMRHKISHRTPDAAQIELSLRRQLEPWVITGYEWIDLSYTTPCRIIAERFEELGADTTPFRRWLSDHYRQRYA